MGIKWSLKAFLFSCQGYGEVMVRFGLRVRVRHSFLIVMVKGSSSGKH